MKEQYAAFFETDAIQRAIERAMQREQREVLGAWRAGYDHVYKFWPVGNPRDSWYVPSNDYHHDIPHRHHAERIDLTSATDEEIKEHLGL